MNRVDDGFQEALDLLAKMPVFSDHEHHQTDAFFAEEMTLDRLLGASYVAWTQWIPDGRRRSRIDVLENTRFNSYFAWFERGLQRIHGIDEPITVDNWEEISAKIRRRYAEDPDFHWRVLLDHGYERLIQDSYWNPGDDEGHPEILTPAFRIDKFMYGYHRDAVGPDDFVPWERYGFDGGTLDDYVEHMRAIIRRRHGEGKVACLKCAEAYNRPITFSPDTREIAEEAFGTPPGRIGYDRWIGFGDYIFHRACELAAELDIPFQVHTGLAQIAGSSPMRLVPVLEAHPRTRFVLFHSGFPWTQEVAGLVHNYPNALPSLTWTPTICTSAAIRALHDYIDVAPSINTITWGSDCWVPEDSVGAQLAWRHVVAKVLAERWADGRLRTADVEVLGRKLMYENGRAVYGIRPNPAP